MSIGKVPEYDSKDKWPTYKLRLNSWLVANEVTDADKKKNILLAVIGRDGPNSQKFELTQIKSSPKLS